MPDRTPLSVSDLLAKRIRSDDPDLYLERALQERKLAASVLFRAEVQADALAAELRAVLREMPALSHRLSDLVEMAKDLNATLAYDERDMLAEVAAGTPDPGSRFLTRKTPVASGGLRGDRA